MGKDEYDLSHFEKENTDKEKIKKGFAVPCRICANAFSRIRLTWRYCDECGVAFCEGEHGNFSNQQGGCVQCGPKASKYKYKD
jgi:hypothetical protein